MPMHKILHSLDDAGQTVTKEIPLFNLKNNILRYSVLYF